MRTSKEEQVESASIEMIRKSIPTTMAERLCYKEVTSSKLDPKITHRKCVELLSLRNTPFGARVVSTLIVPDHRTYYFVEHVIPWDGVRPTCSLRDRMLNSLAVVARHRRRVGLYGLADALEGLLCRLSTEHTEVDYGGYTSKFDANWLDLIVKPTWTALVKPTWTVEETC